MPEVMPPRTSSRGDGSTRRGREKAASSPGADAEEDPNFGSDYKTLKVVGKGGSSTVYKGVLTKTDRYVAIKQIDTEGLNREQVRNIRQEIETIKDLSHEHIVSYLGTRTVPNKIMIFLEYADRGSLRQFYQRRGRLTEPQAANCTRQILKGLIYLHDNGIAHRDVKCANCLLTKGGVIKLGDFGASKRCESDSIVSGLKGTPHWMAPEVIKGTQMTTGWMKADVWSMGCTVVEMLTGKLPYSDFENPMTAMYHIANGQKPPLNDVQDTVSVDLKSFISACCDADPVLRPTCTELYTMPYPFRQSKKRGTNSKDNTPQGTPVKEHSGMATASTPVPDPAECMASQTPDSDRKSATTAAAPPPVESNLMYGIRSTISGAGRDSTVTEELNSHSNNGTAVESSMTTGTAARAVVVTETNISKDKVQEGEFSLAQMIADAERLQAEKTARSPVKTEMSHTEYQCHQSPKKSEQTSDTSASTDNISDDGEYDAIDSELDLDEDDEGRGAGDSSGGVDGVNGGNGSGLKSSSSAHTSGEAISLSTSEGDAATGYGGQKHQQQLQPPPNESSRITYTPKQSQTGPVSGRRSRPSGPSDRLKRGGDQPNLRDSSPNPNRDSSGSNRFRDSGTSVATLQAGTIAATHSVDIDASIEHNQQQYNQHQKQEVRHHELAAAEVLERVGLGSKLPTPHRYSAETPTMIHSQQDGERREFFSDSPTQSQSQEGDIYQSGSQAGMGAPSRRYVSDQQQRQFGYGGVCDSFTSTESMEMTSTSESFEGPHPSAEVPLDLRHGNSNSKNGYGSQSAEEAATVGFSSSSQSAIAGTHGRPNKAIPGSRTSAGSPGVSIETLERASSRIDGATSIRRQAMEELNSSTSTPAPTLHHTRSSSQAIGIASPNRFDIAIDTGSGAGPDMYMNMNMNMDIGSKPRPRARKNSLRSKSASAAGPSAAAGQRLPPMAGGGMMNPLPLAPLGSSMDRAINQHTGNGGAGVGIAHGLSAANDAGAAHPLSLANVGLPGNTVLNHVPHNFTSRSIRSAPSTVARSVNSELNALPPIQSMTPTIKGNKAVKPGKNKFFSASNEGLGTIGASGSESNKLPLGSARGAPL